MLLNYTKKLSKFEPNISNKIDSKSVQQNFFFAFTNVFIFLCIKMYQIFPIIDIFTGIVFYLVIYLLIRIIIL